MDRDFRRSAPPPAMCLISLLCTALGGCPSQRGARQGAVCGACEAQLGGETDDVGAEVKACEGVMMDEEVDAAEAEALGFDSAEFLRRAARSIDAPLRWTGRNEDERSLGGGPAAGYQAETRIRVAFSHAQVFHYVHPDLTRCDGTTCLLPGGGTESQTNCIQRLELDVSAELETQDGALRATLEGRVVDVDPGRRGIAGHGIMRNPYFNARTDLSEVTGTLRLAPKAGGLHYYGTLLLGGHLLSDSSQGELSPMVRIHDADGVTVRDYWPLHGSY